MFGSFRPNLWSSSNQSLHGSREPTLLCNHFYLAKTRTFLLCVDTQLCSAVLSLSKLLKVPKTRQHRWDYCLVAFLFVDIRWRRRVRSNHGPPSTPEVCFLHCRHPR